ncbi:MAG: DUF4232 domain-containing protein [Nocardioidaceae bacterium]
MTRTQVSPTGRTGVAIFAALAAAALVVVPTGARAASMPGCVAADLGIARGVRLAATGHRYDRFRITNTGTRTCRLYGVPTFRFRGKAGHLIGWASARAGVHAKVVVLKPGTSTRVTVGTVEPANITVPGACNPRNARSVDLELAYRPHVYNVPIAVRVCTTEQYRPTAYPVGF